ncbi:unnamed protein product [Penicillium viridicatum]
MCSMRQHRPPSKRVSIPRFPRDRQGQGLHDLIKSLCSSDSADLPYSLGPTSIAATIPDNSEAAVLCLSMPESREKRQSHPLRSREFQKPGSSPLALSCVTATDSEDAIDATPISESIISPDGALDAEKSMRGEDVSDTTLIPESATATDGTGNSKSA